VEAKPGDVLVLEYKLLSENHIGLLHLAVDGRDVKISSQTKDSSTYAYRFTEDGSHRVSVSLEVTQTETGLNEKAGLWIDSIRLVSGDEAEQALARNPVYPAAEEVSLVVLNENVEHFQIVMDGLGYVYAKGYCCTDPVVRLAITLTEDIDPENTFLSDSVGNTISLVPNATADGYLVEIPTDGSLTMKLSQIGLFFNGLPLADASICTSWEEVEEVRLEGVAHMEWEMSVEVLEEAWTVTAPEGDGTYTVTYVDQNGDPVPGVMCQVCDEASCRVFVSDESGVCQFQLPAGAYEIHTLKVPAGYEGDTTTITKAPANGGELSFTLTKN
jgi:archaellum component FlaF (FlaF/FlaG flagellin family)